MRLVVAAVAALLALASCASTLRSHIYLPEPMPANVSWSGRVPAEVTTTAADGLNLRGYFWAPPAEAGDLIVFFHGNGGIRFTAARMAAPLAAGGGLLIASYRGYGDNPGEPTEQGVLADARAFLALARKLAPRSRVYLLGFSLGAAAALHTAAVEEVDGVITIGAFSGLEDVAPWYARGFLPDRFDNRAAIARIAAPILLLHGDQDQVVPYSHAHALRALARRPRFLRLEGAGHGVDFERLAPMIWDNIRQMPR